MRNAGPGILLNGSAGTSTVHDNTAFLNVTGIQAQAGQVRNNRVFGNTGAGILLNSGPAPVDGNAVYGNSVGIEISGFIIGYVITNNLVYANTNQGIYVHNAGTSGSTGVQLINNTVHHDVGSAIRIENNGPNVRLFNNIIVINGGLGIEVIGNAAGFDSDFNDIFPAKPGASVGKFLAAATSATLAAWRTASGKDASSLSVDPLFIDLNGADNLLGWTQPDPQAQFADFGRDDNFHLKRGSAAIDAADSEVAPALDADGLARIDDLGTLNTGNGVFRFYDIGAFEFQGSSADITPPRVVALSPIGMVDDVQSNARFSTLTVTFSEPLEALSARSMALYSLLEAGADTVFGTADDVTVPIAVVGYTVGEVSVQIGLSGQLPGGNYRLTLFGAPEKALVDRAGNALDGDANGTHQTM